MILEPPKPRPVIPSGGSRRGRLRSIGPALVGALLLGLLAGWSTQPPAQDTGEPPARPAGPPESSPEATLGSLSSLTEQRQRIAADSGLAEGTKTQALQWLDQAIASTEQTEGVRGELEALQQRIAGAPQRLTDIEQALSTAAEPKPVPNVDTLTALEQRIRAHEAELAAREEALSQDELDLKALREAGTTLGEQLIDRRQRLEQIRVDLAQPAPPDQAVTLTRAREAALRARASLRQAEIALFNLRLEGSDQLTRLTTRERDLNAAHVRRLRAELAALRHRAQARREAAAAAARYEAEQARGQAANLPLALQGLADENLALSAERERITRAQKRVNDELTEQRRGLEALRADAEGIRQRLALAGPQADVARLLRERRADLPSASTLRAAAQTRQERIREAVHRQLDLDARRREWVDREALVSRLISTDAPSSTGLDREALKQAAHALLDQQHAAVDALYPVYGRYIAQLTELETLAQERVIVADRLRELIHQRLMWIGNLAPITEPSGTPFVSAWDWLRAAGMRPELWAETRALLTAQLIPAIGALVLVLASLPMRRYAGRALGDLSQRVLKARSDRFHLTLQALFWTVLFAAPLPVVFALGGVLLLPSEAALARAIGEGLIVTAAVIAGIRLLHHLCRDKGLAERHFRWSDALRHALRRELAWLTFVALPLIFLVVVAARSGEPAISAAVGRPAFIGLNLALTLFLYRLFRAESPLIGALGEKHLATQTRFLWFPLLLAVPLGLIALSAIGYQYTALFLARRLHTTLWLLFGLVVLRALITRWLYVIDRRRRFEAALKRREEARAQRERARDEDATTRTDETAPLAPLEDPEPDFQSLSEQAGRMLRAALLFLGIVGLWTIWADLLPTLNFLKDVTLPLQATEQVDGVATEVPVTLVDLLRGLLIVAVTLIAARNLPGVLEILVLQRLPIDAGGRYAITTLAQYAIVVLGIVFGFGALGAEWSSIQWLVAALSVGLGFGLQEIVANFVSGVILLLERPVRIGDVITVGNTTGTVARIRIRATTIVNFDEQELLVPNKELITGRVLNWTLSNSVMRVAVRVSVPYETDVPRALEILRAVAAEHPHILDDPAPIITFDRFGDYALECVVRYYMPNLDHWLSTASEVHAAIHRRFHEAGIVLAVPRHRVRLEGPEPLAESLGGRFHGGPPPGTPA